MQVHIFAFLAEFESDFGESEDPAGIVTMAQFFVLRNPVHIRIHSQWLEWHF